MHPSPSGRMSGLLMEDTPSVRGAFAAANCSGGFDMFDLGPSFPLSLGNMALGALNGSSILEFPVPLVAAPPAPIVGSSQQYGGQQQRPQQQQHAAPPQLHHGGGGSHMPPPPPLRHTHDAAAAGGGHVKGLPAALQPAPEELMRFGGAGMQLPKAAAVQQEGSAAALPAKAILPPMHVIERWAHLQG